MTISFWIHFKSNFRTLFLWNDFYEHLQEADENSAWILIRIVQCSNEIPGRIQEGFWWQFWTVSGNHNGRFLVKILEELWWELWKYSNENPGIIVMKILSSEEISAIFLKGILESFDKNLGKIWYEFCKEYDEKPRRILLKIQERLLRILEELCWQ